MSFPLEQPPNTPPNAVNILIVTKNRETFISVLEADVADVYNSLSALKPFTITSAAETSTGKFVRAWINPQMVEFARVELTAVPEDMPSIARISQFRPKNGGDNDA